MRLDTFGPVFRRGRLPDGNRPLVMGILNLTPDSFSDGGRYPSPTAAIDAALAMEAAGADIIDIGAVSTRPGLPPASEDEEIARLRPVLGEAARRTSLPISVDTWRTRSAGFALAEGADILNDQSCLRALDTAPGDAAAGWPDNLAYADLAAREKAGLILMHSFGLPATRRPPPGMDAARVFADVADTLRRQAELAVERGVDRRLVALDPGVGFGKDFAAHARLLRDFDQLASLGFPLVAACSRKSLIGDALGLPADERREASLALAALAYSKGARLFRVHDVQATRRVVDMLAAIDAAAET